VVRWDLDRQPGARPSRPGAPTVLAAGGDPDAPEPVAGVGPATDGAVVEVPRDHAALRRRDAQLAARWRDATAEALERCFGAGLVVGAFDRGRSAYVLAPEETW
jgi:predicted GNAT superfamily acetyltransferase